MPKYKTTLISFPSGRWYAQYDGTSKHIERHNSFKYLPLIQPWSHRRFPILVRTINPVYSGHSRTIWGLGEGGGQRCSLKFSISVLIGHYIGLHILLFIYSKVSLIREKPYLSFPEHRTAFYINVAIWTESEKTKHKNTPNSIDLHSNF